MLYKNEKFLETHLDENQTRTDDQLGAWTDKGGTFGGLFARLEDAGDAISFRQ